MWYSWYFACTAEAVVPGREGNGGNRDCGNPCTGTRHGTLCRVRRSHERPGKRGMQSARHGNLCTCRAVAAKKSAPPTAVWTTQPGTGPQVARNGTCQRTLDPGDACLAAAGYRFQQRWAGVGPPWPAPTDRAKETQTRPKRIESRCTKSGDNKPPKRSVEVTQWIRRGRAPQRVRTSVYPRR